MLSQSDSVSLRPAQARVLPNTWGWMMSQSSTQLSRKWEDRDVVLADESALQRRVQRMTEVQQQQQLRKHRPIAPPQVDLVDAWGYYPTTATDGESEGQGDVGGPTVRIGSGVAAAAPSPRSQGRPILRSVTTPTPPPTAGALHSTAPAAFETPSRRTGLLTPASAFHMNTPSEVPRFHNERSRVDLATPYSEHVTQLNSERTIGSGGGGGFSMAKVREIRPPPRM